MLRDLKGEIHPAPDYNSHNAFLHERVMLRHYFFCGAKKTLKTTNPNTHSVYSQSKTRLFHEEPAASGSESDYRSKMGLEPSATDGIQTDAKTSF